MSDYGIALGDPGGGPPVNLPTLGLPPPPPARIRITPEAKPKPVVEAKETPRIVNKPIVPDDYPDYTPELSRKLQPLPLGAEPQKPINPDDYPDYTPEAAAPKPMPEIGGGEAAAMGVRSALTAGAYPFMKGVAAAAPSVTPQQFFSQPNPEYGGLTESQAQATRTPDEQAARQKTLATEQQAYRTTAGPQYEREQAARAQHPGKYFLGELGGGVLLGGAGLVRTAAARSLGTLSNEAIANTLNTALQARVGQGAGAALRRIGSAAGSGATYGATSGVGETLSSGDTSKLGENVALGAAAGSLTGGALRLAGEAPRAGSLLYRGNSAIDQMVGAKIKDTWANAGPIQPQDIERLRTANPAITPAQLHQQAIEDWIARGEVTPRGPITPEMRQAATTAGRPLTNLDLGGTEVDRLARKAANISPEAEGIIRSSTEGAFLNQAPRVAAAIDNLTGGRLDLDALKARAKPGIDAAYAQAMADGNKRIYSPGLRAVIASDAGQTAMDEALRRVSNEAGKRRQIADVGTEVLGGVRIPKNPNLEFWDKFQQVLTEMADKSPAKLAQAIKKMHEDVLMPILDNRVQSYARARAGAAKYLGERDAYLAGKKFVDSTDPEDGRKAVLAYQNNPYERELFARGYATEQADRVLARNDRENALKEIEDNKIATANRAIAMGPARANQMMAILRAEEIIWGKRGVLGNSTTTKQLKDMGHAPQSLGVVAAIMEATHSLPPGAAAAAFILYGLFRKHAANVNEKTSADVARLLVSSDDREIARGIQKAAREPGLMQALKVASTAVSVGAAREPRKTGATAYALATESPAVLEYFRSKEHHPEPKEPVEAEEAR